MTKVTTKVMTKVMKRNIIIFCVGLMAIAAGLVGDLYLRDQKPELFPSIGKTPFSLISHEGKPITNRDLIGTPTAIYFGFTWCPDICPTSLSKMADMKAELAALDTAGQPLQLVFFSVDPARDTVQQMADYVSLFDGDIIGITGDAPLIDEALRRFGIFAQKVGEGEDYLVDHSSSVYLYDQTGRFEGTISPAEPYEMGLAKLARLVGAKGLN